MDGTQISASGQSNGTWVPGWGKRWKPADYLVFGVLSILCVIVFHAATGNWLTAVLVTLVPLAAALAFRIWRVRRMGLLHG